MRIREISKSLSIILSNEEDSFVKKYGDQVPLDSLDDHDTWIARNLVRKGVYEIDGKQRYLTKTISLNKDSKR